MLHRILAIVLLISAAAVAADEFTLYDLQPPETHQFAITYDVTATREGAPFFFNPIRPGSVATKERVIERSSGKELKFETVNGKDAKANRLGTGGDVQTRPSSSKSICRGRCRKAARRASASLRPTLTRLPTR